MPKQTSKIEKKHTAHKSQALLKILQRLFVWASIQTLFMGVICHAEFKSEVWLKISFYVLRYGMGGGRAEAKMQSHVWGHIDMSSHQLGIEFKPFADGFLGIPTGG